MFGLRRRDERVDQVRFCERCGQVCSSACRSQARLERSRDQVAALRLTTPNVH